MASRGSIQIKKKEEINVVEYKIELKQLAKIIFQAEMSNFNQFQLHYCDNKLLFFILSDSKLNIFLVFGVSVGLNKKSDSVTLDFSDGYSQTIKRFTDEIICRLIVSCSPGTEQTKKSGLRVCWLGSMVMHWLALSLTARLLV